MEPTPLLLLPGLDGTEVFFRPLIACLPEAIQPIPLRYPESGPHDYRGLLDVVLRAIADVSSCYVLASSFSGPLAVMLAAAEPHKVRGVILVATFASSPRPALVPLQFAITGPTVWGLRFSRRLPIWLLRSSQDALKIAKRETWSRVSARSLAGRARAALAADVREELREIRCPVLCVRYDADTVVRSSITADILQHCPHARAVTLPGGHLAMFSDPAPLADEVVRFVGAPVRVTTAPRAVPA